MHYVRFLKPPRLETQDTGSSIVALVTLTSDLSDGFYPVDAALSVDVLSQKPSLIGRSVRMIASENVQWRAGMRVLPLSCKLPFDCTGKNDLRLSIQPQKKEIRQYPELRDGTLVMQPVLGVESADICLSQGKREAERLMLRHCPFTDATGDALQLWEEMGETIAGHVWNAGVATATFIYRALKQDSTCVPALSSLVRTRAPEQIKVLELGSGCGIVGLTFAHVLEGCKVLLTDLPQNEGIAKRNIENFQAQSRKAGKERTPNSQLIFEALDWREGMPPGVQDQRFDVVIASDVTYNADSSPYLVRTLSRAADASPGAVVIVAMKVRHPSEKVFFDFMNDSGLETRQHARVEAPLTDYPDEAMEEPEAIQIYQFVKFKP